MNVGVDAHVLSGRFQGSRTYLLNLYKAVLSKDISNKYYFLGHWNGNRPFGENSEYVEYPSTSRIKRLLYQTVPLIKRFGIEVLHSNYISPLYLPCKSLLTIHDVLYETHPQFYDKARVIQNKILIRYSVSRAQQIHTVSEYSRQALLEAYRVPDEIVKVVPNGVNLKTFFPGDRANATARIAAKFHIKDYILSVGRLEPRKNYVGLLSAYAMLKQERADVGPLVIVGQRDFGYRDIFDTLSDLKLADSVKVLDSVDDAWLPDIYRASRLFVYPSFAEGFGIPPLEAMACGIPVVSSDTTALREVIQDGGVLVNPYNKTDIADAMLALINDREWSIALTAKGIEQARKWSWDNSADRYLDAISSL